MLMKLPADVDGGYRSLIEKATGGCWQVLLEFASEEYQVSWNEPDSEENYKAMVHFVEREDK